MTVPTGMHGFLQGLKAFQSLEKMIWLELVVTIEAWHLELVRTAFHYLNLKVNLHRSPHEIARAER